MFLLWWIYFKLLVLTRIRTEIHFAANDPWNQNCPTSFLLEAYLLAPKGTAPPAGHNDSCRYGIRPELDATDPMMNAGGECRMLPESLVRLWRAGRIPAEALPGLLHRMEPTLKASDRNLVVLTRAYTTLRYVMTAMFALWFLARVAVQTVLGSHDNSSGWINLTVMSLLVGLLLYLLFFRPQARRKKQMEWALAHL